MNFNFIAILAIIVAAVASFGINENRSVLAFLVWYGISFVAIWAIFILFKFLFA